MGAETIKVPGHEMARHVVCTGTNFLVRAKAFVEVGMSPQYTMTEDFALGMELKKKKWHCRYVQAYLAVGEAPDQIRNCFQQRSRWTKVISADPIVLGPCNALTGISEPGMCACGRACLTSALKPQFLACAG